MVKTYAAEDTLYILAKGFLFALEICQPQELALLKGSTGILTALMQLKTS